MLEIPRAETTLLRVEPQFDVTVFENHAVLLTEHRKKHPSFEIGPSGIPIYVEIVGERRLSAPLENIEPPGVVATTDSHMVGDDVEDEAHSVPMQCVDELAEFLLAAELRVEPVVVYDIVAVR